MIKERYVAAIEISSSKVIGVVGKIHSDGRLDVIAVEKEKCTECVRYGIIQNVEETATRISRIISHLERHPAVQPKRISGIFIGLSGRSIRSISTEVEMNFTDETVINRDTIERMRRKAIETAIDSSLEIIDAVPRSYTIGHTVTKEPIGNLGTSIRATYDLIVCRPQIKKNIQRMALGERLGINNCGFVVSELAAAKLVLSEEEKRLGCMLVDLGAETTPVTIYKNGDLQYFATLPLGSRNITRDIMSLDQLEERAEDIKIQSGNAMPDDTPSSLDIHGVRLSDVSKLVVARCEEIVANIVEQIQYAGLKDSDLPRGIIIMGGGSKLNNIDTLIKDISKMRNVRNAQLPSYINLEETKVSPIELIQVVSVLYSGATETDSDCLVMPDITETPGSGIPNTEEEPTSDDVHETTNQVKRDRFSKFKKWITRTLVPTDEDENENELM